MGQLPVTLTQWLLQGGYPSLYDRDVLPQDWFSNYMATYVERDVRQFIPVRDLGQFQTFVKMCASRTGQLLNLASLGADCGISAVTAKQWLTVLETCYIELGQVFSGEWRRIKWIRAVSSGICFYETNLILLS